ncbi:hypothetical protein KP509_12G088200 [Ceratopteris richardii]|uniref:Fungal lipase-type domain-containing protein n=1 Tax=Ceratopteris richardii TaxID=49495 RepID=A0A8T2TNW8_CERRI|nr:hypothetical protein KP509_12G088200 [Ceratopteris richardii]KAH7424070.1 hypothetical protein KP509_12G088200 [Ceratopteris richardii]
MGSLLPDITRGVSLDNVCGNVNDRGTCSQSHVHLTTAVLQERKRATPTPLSPSPLPLPPSRPLFPSPLKFLWFGKGDPTKSSAPSGETGSDGKGDLMESVASMSEKDQSSVDRYATAKDIEADIDYLIEKQIASMQLDTASPAEGRSNESAYIARTWISNVFQQRLISEGSDPDMSILDPISGLFNDSPRQRSSIESEGLNAIDEVSSLLTPNNGVDDEHDIDDESDHDLCSVEDHELDEVVHDRDSVSKYLQEVSMSEVLSISKSCLLSNLAYIIPEVQSKNVLEDHRLSFVTSSFVKKEKAEARAALERAEAKAEKRKDSKRKRGKPHATQDAVLMEGQLALEDNNSELLVSDTDLSSDSEFRADVAPEAMPNLLQDDANKRNKDEGGACQEEAKSEAASAKAQNGCPCEWFICDDEVANIRYLAIQGSESLASWQTNLSFDPTNFEGLGTLVHRGAYEAAQGLYELVEKEMVECVQRGGKLCFTGHSLGGSLATLIAMMLVRRCAVKAEAVESVVSLGGPCVLCAGEKALRRLEMEDHQFVNIVMHRDIVPRAFACDYPPHVVRILQHVNGSFRDHPCFNHQRAMYAPVGQMMILQPDDAQSPSHPLLPPSTAGLYLIREPSYEHDLSVEKLTSPRSFQLEANKDAVSVGRGSDRTARRKRNRSRRTTKEVRGVQRAFFNLPHPLDALRDPGAYGFEGAISRDHDPRSYNRALSTVLIGRLQHQVMNRRRLYVPQHTVTSAVPQKTPSRHSPSPAAGAVHNTASPSGYPKQHVVSRTAEHLRVGVIFILSVTTGFMSWV